MNDTDDLMIINKSGITIRLRISDLRTIGRATQGVRLIKISGNDEISSVAKVAAEEEKEEVEVALVTETSAAEETEITAGGIASGPDDVFTGGISPDDAAEEADLA